MEHFPEFQIRKLPRRLIPALFCAFPWLAHAGDTLTIDFYEAKDHIGQKAVVKGVVAHVSLWFKAVFLDFGAANPDAVFTAVSYNLPFSVLAAFEGQTVSGSGTITGDHGKPEIIISNLAQIAAIHEPMVDNGPVLHTWRTYAPGQAPPARMLSLDETGALADRGRVHELLYLRGEFRVTASGISRAVLRDATRPDDQSPRIVVDYPPGAVPPKEKDRFVRDAARPYQISEVRRGTDGVITIYVREIMAAEARKKQ